MPPFRARDSVLCMRLIWSCRRALVLGFAACAVLSAVGCAKDPPGQSADAGASSGMDAAVDLESAPRLGTVMLPTAGAHPISPFAFGQNYWNWEPSWGAAVAGTDTLARAAGVKLIRAGGANNELQTPNVFSDAELDQFVAYTKSVGAEPYLQVSLIKNSAGLPASAADAAAMVTYANTTKAYGIKYWSVGNEPDLYTSQNLQAATYTAADYCKTFRAYVTAMKAVDPTIKILGPELSWKYVSGNDWLTPFLDGCKDVVDIVSVHRYPFAPNQVSVSGAFDDASAYRQVIRSLRANLDSHGLTTVPLAITEEHITYDGDPAKSTLAASPQTFYAGMWAADVLGVGLEEDLWTSAFWHLADAPSGWKLAFILGKTPMPTYYATALIATSFAGQILVPTGVPTGFSVYASRDAASGKAVALVLNKTSNAARLTLVFDDLPPQDVGFPGESMTLVVLDAAGVSPRIQRYTKDLADAGMPPVTIP